MAFEITLLFHLGIILIAATLFNFIARLLGQPPLLAYLAAGLFIGPFGLGGLGVGIGGIPLGVQTTQEILLLSGLGVAFLLFSVGVESELSKFRELGKIAIIGTILQVVLTVMLVFFMNGFLHALSFEQALYLGLIVAFSSTTIVVKILSDSKEINTLHGRLMIGFLLMQDVLVIIAMPFLTNIGSVLSAPVAGRIVAQIAVMLLLAFLVNRHIYPKLFAFAARSDELFFLSAMSSVFLFIFISYILDFPMAVGAFIAGVTISTLPYSAEVSNRIRGVRDFLATIFFVTLGIQISPSFVNFPLGLALLLVGIVFILKPLVVYAITLLSGYGNKVGIAVALALAQVSEFGFIIASQGKPILDNTPGLYSFIILLIAVSMAMTPYFMSSSGPAYNYAVSNFPGFVKEVRKQSFLYRRINALGRVPEKISGHIAIFGGGIVGANIAEALSRHTKTVVIDSDPEVVCAFMQKGINTVYGSVDNEQAWQKANVEKAKLVVIAVPSAKASLPLIRKLKKSHPQQKIFARAHYFHDALALYEAGVDAVIMPHVIGSNIFVKKIVEYLDTGKVEEFSEGYRDLFTFYLREKSREERKSLL